MKGKSADPFTEIGSIKPISKDNLIFPPRGSGTIYNHTFRKTIIEIL